MAIVINGSGTVTGISVGGLPDGIVDAGTLATNSVDSAELIDGSIDTAHLASGNAVILQTVQTQITTTTNTSTMSPTWVDTSSLLVITPSATSSKILVMFCAPCSVHDAAADAGLGLRVSRAISGGATSYPESLSNAHLGASYVYSGGATSYVQEFSQLYTIVGYDSPSTTSAVTYTLQLLGYSAATVRNNNYGDSQTSITLMEIKG